MVLQFLAEEQPLDGVVVGEEGHHVLQEEALAVGQQLGGVVDLGVDVVRDDVADVDLEKNSSFANEPIVDPIKLFFFTSE